MNGLLDLGNRFLAEEKGAEVTELAIVLVLVSAVTVVVVGVLGLALQSDYGTVATDL